MGYTLKIRPKMKPQYICYSVLQTKVKFVFKIFYHLPAHIVKCVPEYIFSISKNKQANKNKNKNTKK